jgi:hypothetical protein
MAGGKMTVVVLAAAIAGLALASAVQATERCVLGELFTAEF